jgi:hypothetical protein
VLFRERAPKLVAKIRVSDLEPIADLVADRRRDTDSPGSAMVSSRVATLTPSPKMSPSWTIASPRLMPMRMSSARAAGISRPLHLVMAGSMTSSRLQARERSRFVDFHERL